MSAGWHCRNASTVPVQPVGVGRDKNSRAIFVSGVVVQEQLCSYIVIGEVPVCSMDMRHGRGTMNQVPLTPSFGIGRSCLEQNVL